MINDAAFQSLQDYNWLVGTVWPNPAHIVDAPKPEQATPYHVWPIQLQTPKMISYSAPDYGFKANMLYPTRNIQSGNYGLVNAQAPTQGVYSGIPSGCGPNGVHGGNPYS